MVQLLMFIDVEHKLHGCKYNRDQSWCFVDVKCPKGQTDED